jgi:hypothetical protein
VTRAPLAISTSAGWPELPAWSEWSGTLYSLHRWSQVVGKLRMAASPPVSHWWHVPLYVTPRGLTTGSAPFQHRLFSIDFDLVDHRLVVIESGGGSFGQDLEPMSVADFYRRLMDGVRSIGIDLPVYTLPSEVADPIPFELDTEPRSYDRAHVEALRLVLIQAQRALEAFKARFAGKVSPVHFFWGGFDLAVTRFSGRRAPLHKGGAPGVGDWVNQEAYSHEVSSAGWWVGDDTSPPNFYSYMYPEPDGFSSASVQPEAAEWSTRYGEFVLPYEAVWQAPDPDAMVDAFLTSTYSAGADLAGWDRPAFESPLYPFVPPPHRAWSTGLKPMSPAAMSRQPRAPKRHGRAPDADDD